MEIAEPGEFPGSWESAPVTAASEAGVPSSRAPRPPMVVERTLQLPSWERVGSLLLSLKDSICGGTPSDGRNGGGVAGGSEENASSPPPTLSTPVRIVLPTDIDPGVAGPSDPALAVADAGLSSEPAREAGAAAEVEVRGHASRVHRGAIAIVRAGPSGGG